MKTNKAITAGVIGAVVMTVIMWLARAGLGLPANLEMMLGTLFGFVPGQAAWLVGFAVHLVAGAVFGVIYAWCFENWAHRAGWLTGVEYGVAHTILSGLFLGAIPALHPLIPEQMAAPGMFMANLGLIGVVAFAMLHLIFGAIVGAMYGPVLHPTPREAIHGEPRHAH